MALRVLMLRKKLDDAKANLAELEAKNADFESREAELERSIEEAQTAEERSVVEEAVTTFESDRAAHDQAVSELRETIEGLEAEIRALEEKEEKREMPKRINQAGVELRSSMEYREAFMNYVRTGQVSDILEFEKRDDQVTTTSALGVLLPVTVMQEIITALGGVYGQLYSKVRKTNLKGGVKYPIGAFSATFNRITETTTSYRQKVSGITSYVEFSYKIGEIRLAKTLLEEILEVPVFEKKFGECIAEAYVKAMDTEIMVGSETNEMVGILTEAEKVSGSRIAAGHIIEFTAADMADWTKWQEKLFAVIPLAMRSMKPEFVMTANTYEANIKTLKDQNNRPVYAETFNPVDGAERATFKGKEVAFVEEDILDSFNDASDGDYFGMYWVPDKAYCINENMRFTVVEYFDHETNQRVKKALVVNDGKPLNTDFIYLLKKKVVQETQAGGAEGGSGGDNGGGNNGGGAVTG